MMDRMDADPARDDMLYLVDGLDRVVGQATKEEAHRRGLLHRAFSVVLLRDTSAGPEVLLTRRAEGKYHSAGLWANSCCSHPRVSEVAVEAAHRRVLEELGVRAAGLEEIGAFCYRAAFADGIVEFEYDHVFVGRAQGDVHADASEVSEVRWASPDEVARELAERPEAFSAWAPMVLSMALAAIVGEGAA